MKITFKANGHQPEVVHSRASHLPRLRLSPRAKVSLINGNSCLVL